MAEVSCRALFAYNGVGGEKITTLDFEAGEIIKVLFSGDTGWWEGEKNGSRGWFPASYVRRISLSNDSNASEEWREVKSEAGEIYYVNVRTNESSWEIPTLVKPTPADTIPKTMETSANTSMNNVHGNNNLHLNLPLTENEAPSQTVSQPTTPGTKEDDNPSFPETKSLPIISKSSPSPVLQRSKTFSTRTNSPANGTAAKPHVRMLNGISFPDENEAKEQNLLQPGKFSYCDYFWSDKIENHSFQPGFCILYQKMLKGKQMCKELSDLVKMRESLEMQYAKGLANLANSTFAEQEGGTLGETVKQIKAAFLLESKIHQEFANKLRSDISQGLLEQKDKEKKELKKLEASMADLRKQVQLKYQAAERSKQQLVERTKDFESKLNSPKHTKEDIQRARRKSTKNAEDLTHAVDAYNKQRQQWFEEMVTSSLVLERHEVARVNDVKQLLSSYSKLLQGTDMKSHETCDTINDFIKKVDADKDREQWVRKNATGKVKPVDLVI